MAHVNSCNCDCWDTLTKSLGTVAGVCSVLLRLEVLYAAFAVVPRETHL